MSRKLNTIDMLSGRPLPGIFRFALPLAASSVLQLLFNAADVIVVGKYVGSTALAAVGSTASLINLLISLFLGISVGVNITVARQVGARDDDGVRRAVHTSVSMAAVMGLILLAFGGIMAVPMLRLMNVPEDVLPLAALYLRIYFLGMPASMLYNFCAGVLRAYGDTKRPFWFLSVAGVANVLLNLFFVIVLKIGVAGVALATVLSQYVSCVLVLVCLSQMEGPARLDLLHPQFDLPAAGQIIRIGLPAGIQSVLFSISNVLIQSSINAFGSAVIAGNTAASNLGNFINASCTAVSHASISFVSQNNGAKKYDRMMPICRDSFLAVVLIGVPLAAFALLFGRPLLGIYVNRADPAFRTVIEVGLLHIRYVDIFQFTCGFMANGAGLVRGLGRSWLPMFVSLLGSCVLRVVWIYTVFRAVGTLQSLYLSYPISWILTTLMHLACFVWFYRRLRPAAAGL